MSKIVESGFTITEMLISLIVFSIIFGIMFYSIPKLQMTNRNAQRQDDVDRIASAITSYVTNNKGKNVTTPADVAAVKDRSKPFKQFIDATMVFTATALSDGSPTESAVTNLNTVKIVTGAECQTDNSAKRAKGENRRSTVLLYAAEGASAAISKCLQV